MMEDTIIEELHQFREKWAAQFNYDVHALVADLRRSQQEENRQVVNLPPNRITDDSDLQAQQAKLTPEKLDQAA